MTTVAEVLDKKGIRYMDSGKDYLIGCLNPEHDDSNPSLRVDKLTGLYHCFSCGFKGTLLKDSNVKDFQRSIKVQKLSKKIAKLMFTNPILPKGSSPFLLNYRGIGASTYEKFQAFEDTQNKEFVDRVVFPITDLEGDILLFCGRHKFTSEKDKYIFHPAGIKPPCFPARVEPIDGSIILVEGLFDMLNLYDKGIKNVVCNFGCSVSKDIKTEERKFIPYKLQGVTTIYIMFDGDKAGRTGAAKLQNVLTNLFNIDIIDLDDNVDPGDLSEESIQKLRGLIYD